MIAFLFHAPGGVKFSLKILSTCRISDLVLMGNVLYNPHGFEKSEGHAEGT